jgi:hypothetical protein
LRYRRSLAAQSGQTSAAGAVVSAGV